MLPAGVRYCPEHEREYDARRGSRQARGYDANHDRARAAMQRRIDAGEVVYCARGCGRRITGRLWHLDHDDEDRTRYKGASCVPCNTGAGGKRSARRRR